MLLRGERGEKNDMSLSDLLCSYLDEGMKAQQEREQSRDTISPQRWSSEERDKQLCMTCCIFVIKLLGRVVGPTCRTSIYLVRLDPAPRHHVMSPTQPYRIQILVLFPI